MTDIVPTQEVWQEYKSTPKDRAVINAMVEVMSHKEDMEKARVPLETIQQIAVNAENRVKLEFEAKEKEDPIRRVVSALNEATITEDEKVYVEQVEAMMESQRSQLAKGVREAKIRARKQSDEFNLGYTLNELWNSNRLPKGSNFPNETPGKGVLAIRFLEPWVGNHKSTMAQENRIELTPDFQERILKKLGALEPDEELDDLKLLKNINQVSNHEIETYYDGSFPSDNRAHNVSTNLEGVSVSVGISEPNQHGTLKTRDLDVIQKIAEFPTSV